MANLREEALQYHAGENPGKLEIVASKKCNCQADIIKAYTPGVAQPCLNIEKNPEDAYKYTGKGNLIAVMSNGSSVLGLGSIGSLAAKPLLEGKCMMFKKFADINAIDIEIDERETDKIVSVVKAISPTFGAICFDDIEMPVCMEVEEKLAEVLNIPVYNDDYHSIGIVILAALINAAKIQGKNFVDMKVVVAGTSPGVIGFCELVEKYGVQHKNIIICDDKCVLHEGRLNTMNKYIEKFATESQARTLADALKGADVFVGMLKGNLITPEVLKTMNPKAVIFALTNPDPEIPYQIIQKNLPEAIIATGRSDFPNQIVNALSFPYLLAAAMDVRAKKITIEMKIAAAKAIADVAHLPIPNEIKKMYNNEDMKYGPEYILPKMWDSRLVAKIAPEVAKAAIESGVATNKDFNIDEYYKRFDSSYTKKEEEKKEMSIMEMCARAMVTTLEEQGK